MTRCCPVTLDWAKPTLVVAGRAASVAVVPPAETKRVVEDCARLGIKHLWMQQGAESDEAVYTERTVEVRPEDKPATPLPTLPPIVARR